MGIPGVTPDWWAEWSEVTVPQGGGWAVVMAQCPKCRGLFMVPVEHNCEGKPPVFAAGECTLTVRSN